jgi:hypothetical protein
MSTHETKPKWIPLGEDPTRRAVAHLCCIDCLGKIANAVGIDRREALPLMQRKVAELDLDEIDRDPALDDEEALR